MEEVSVVCDYAQTLSCLYAIWDYIAYQINNIPFWIEDKSVLSFPATSLCVCGEGMVHWQRDTIGCKWISSSFAPSLIFLATEESIGRGGMWIVASPWACFIELEISQLFHCHLNIISYILPDAHLWMKDQEIS